MELKIVRAMRSAGFNIQPGHTGNKFILTREDRNITIREVLRVIWENELPLSTEQITIFPGAVLIELK